MSTDLERARELLAAQYDKCGLTSWADKMRANTFEGAQPSYAAIVAAYAEEREKHAAAREFVAMAARMIPPGDEADDDDRDTLESLIRAASAIQARGGGNG